ncbi:MAG: transcriptional regulatory protein [Cyanobacteria bacterium RYN_339]|nr:transcriptional regulatory protein [Cyanobacteria bacterium RYN_339]
MSKILIVDDEALSHKLISGVIRVLDGITIENAYSAQEALQMALAEPPDLIICDVNMPEVDGLTFCRQVRDTAQLADVPLLLLTARREPEDKYDGFLQGADDFLSKPFDIMELQLRTKALLRRRSRAGEARDGAKLSHGALALDVDTYQVRFEEQEARLTGSELAIMRHLVEHPRQAFKAEVLLNRALNYPINVGSPQVVHTHVRNIRTKLKAAGFPEGLLASSWQGYVLDLPQ